MRFLVWILGVLDCLAGLMTAEHVAPAWVWAWWVFLGLWVLAGVGGIIVALARAAAIGGQGAAPRVLAPRPGVSAKAQGGE